MNLPAFFSSVISVLFMLGSIPFVVLGIIIVAFIVIKLLNHHIQYEKSCYKNLTNHSKWKVLRDKGLYGEFLSVKALEGISDKERIFVNVYLQKAKRKNETTETDIIYVNPSGVFVLESKNYSGWIYGNEKDKTWTQVLNKHTKIRFFNPIRQNEGHIKAIKKALDGYEDIPFYSLIVFSKRCKLKKITVTSERTYVFNRPALRRTVQDLSKESILTEEQIHAVGEKLSAFTNVTEEVKENHIKQIQSRLNPKTKDAVETVTVREETTETDISAQTLTENHTETVDAQVIVTEDVNSQVTTDEHAEAVDTQVMTTEDDSIEDEEEQRCPKCGAEMVLRTAKRGANAGKEFWGCVNYPKCREIVTLSSSV